MQDEQFWRSAPKTFCDDAGMSIMSGSGDTFLLALRSGGNAQVFAFTPEHAKRFLQLVTHHVREYEDKNGPIEVEQWTPETKAPFQVDDLKGQ